MKGEDILTDVLASRLSGNALRQYAMRRLSELDGYDWCGVYRMESGELVLDEFVGEPTEHVRIPIGYGICGTAVAENRNQIVEDVTAVDNYLACSPATKSEIVVLIRDGARILGQIDIDSHRKAAFGVEDERLLQRLAEALAIRWF